MQHPETTSRRRPTSDWLLIAAPFVLLGASALVACRLPVHRIAAEVNGGRAAPRDDAGLTPDQVHAAIFEDEQQFPSALSCAQCHPRHFAEWAASPHAYAQMSPVFNAMHGTVLKRTNGTNGDFCIRCHTPVGMQKNEPLFVSNLARHPASREGITCIVCHRVNKRYGKVSGRFGIVRAGLDDPVFGPEGGARLRAFTAENKVRRAIHADVEPFFELRRPGFCATCHDVNQPGGFRLEEAFSSFKTSPAAAAGTTCQDCHMGKTPGKAEGYDEGPAAIVNKKATAPRRLTNHMMAGPDHSVIHPGLFPHNLAMVRSKRFTLADWLTFDYEAGWGATAFEDRERLRTDAVELRAEGLEADELAEELKTLVEDYGGPLDPPTAFPAAWADYDKRRRAAELIRVNLQRLARYAQQRKAVLQAGFELADARVLEATADGVTLRAQVRNPMTGHSSPTGFIAERVLFLRVTVTDAAGAVVFGSGDLDPNGDVRDSHSVYVHNGELPRDRWLFSLQSKFLIRNLRGGEREQVLAVNRSIDPLPFVRPATRAAVLSGRPGGARIHRQTLAPLASRWPTYRIPAAALTGRSPYRARFELIAGMVPSNLIAEIAEVGFDYRMSPRTVAERVLRGVPWGPYSLDPAPDATRAREPSAEAFAAYRAARAAERRTDGIGGHVVLGSRTVRIDVR